jgi:hypothetical protein
MQFSFGYLKRFLAGAIFGLYMAHLLYILNPQIEITPARLVLVTLLYGLSCGLLFGTALWLLRIARIRLFGRGDDVERRHGFGLVVVAAFVSAAVFYIHLLLFKIYLPVGAVRILSIDTNLITGTAFVLLVLWLFERTVRPPTSRMIVVAGFVLILISSFFLYQRRDRYEPDPRSAEVANIGTIAGKRPVILVVLRDVPYDWIVTLIGEGSLPWFDRSMRTAFLTRIEPFPTSSPKALWASLATGQLPSRHGVTGRFSYHTPMNARDERFLLVPSGVGFAAWGLIPPVERISAQLPAGDSLALWQMFGRLGLRELVVGWPATSPARPVATMVISNRFFAAPKALTFETWPPGAGAALDHLRSGPSDRRAVLAFAELGGAAAGVLSRARDIDDFKGRLVLELQKKFDLTAVWMDGFPLAADAARVGGNTLPLRSTAAGIALRRYLSVTDQLLSTIQGSAPDATLVVVSCSGPRPPTLPGNLVAMVQSLEEGQDPGADDGFLLLAGRGIAHRENPPSAQVVDVVPTVLFSATLPLARDMDGRVMTEAFDDAFLRDNAISLIQTYRARELIVRRSTE